MARNMSPQQMKFAYENGSTIESLMHRTGRDYGTVKNQLEEAGARLVTGGWNRRFRKGIAE